MLQTLSPRRLREPDHHMAALTIRTSNFGDSGVCKCASPEDRLGLQASSENGPYENVFKFGNCPTILWLHTQILSKFH